MDGVKDNVFFVKSATNTKRLADSIMHTLKEKGFICIRAIGAGAVSQMIKGIIIACSKLNTNNGGKVVRYNLEFADVPDTRDGAENEDSVSAIQANIRYE